MLFSVSRFSRSNSPSALYRLFIKTLLACSLFSAEALSSNIVDYDIIYVRYDYDEKRVKDNIWQSSSFLTIPQGEDPYDIEDGADLVLLKPDGSEIILVDCGSEDQVEGEPANENTDTCSVMDPTISFDAKTVYYSLIEKEGNESASWLYKINLTDPSYTPIRLTFDDGFESALFAANTTEDHMQSSHRGIRDMSPIPLADGRLLFTSNRAGLTALNIKSQPQISSSTIHLYTMDDHDGELTTAKTSQISRLEVGTMHLAQHPIQLKDGRILFSSWQDVATRFQYAMTSLFTVNPDGTNLKQFTEPHDHHKNVEHFVTQLQDEQVVSGSYYPSFDFGYGILLRYPISSDGPDFIRGKESHNDWSESREFSRKNTQIITPHTTGRDIPAPEIEGIAQGKYSMPAVTKNSGLLVSYSQGYVNRFGAVCGDVKTSPKCDDLKAGIYLIPNATTNQITNKDQLITIKDDLYYNELWPKPVLPYQALYGVEKPTVITPKINTKQIKVGQAAGLIGTSSMYNRQSSYTEVENDPDGSVFQSKSANRELHEGDWTVQGTDVGVYANSDIYGVRIISTPAKPFTKMLSKFAATAEKPLWQAIFDDFGYTKERIVGRYTSFHGERWEILGEFPLTNKETTDLQGNPDTSWVAKVPADTPFLIQTIDKKGMTLNTELTWRGLKPGEERTDCGGCHAHSIEPLEFSSTQAYKNMNSASNITSEIMSEVTGIDLKDSRVTNGVWDLTTNTTPLITGNATSPAVRFAPESIVGIEFHRDVQPLLSQHCISCHTIEGVGNALVLDGSNEIHPYLALKKSSDSYISPQQSKYIRISQARESLLAWIVWGERLDGRTNESRTSDIDYSAELHSAHESLAMSDIEKRNIARWIDLGSPVNFHQTDGMGYTDDNQLPIININVSDDNKTLNVGLIDAHSGIDWSSVKVSYYALTDENLSVIQELSATNSNASAVGSMLGCQKQVKSSDRINGINTYDLPLNSNTDYMIEVEVLDLWGNKNIISKKVQVE